MNSSLAILIVAGIIDIFISLLVLFRNRNKAANVMFALTSIGLVVWASLNFLSTYLPDSATLVVTRATGFVAAVLITGFYVLSTIFPNKLPSRPRFRNALFAITALISALCASDLFVQNAIHTDSGLAVKEGILYPVYSIFILGLFILFNVNFVVQYRHAQKYARSQIQLMGAGIFITVAFIILSNMIMPALTEDWSSSNLGTVFLFPFVGMTAYAIIKRRMFDVRLIISRTIAYMLTIGIVASIYAAVMIFAATRLTTFGTVTSQQVIVLLIPTIFIGLTFHRLQLFFDRLTKKIFYRDAYELRNVLDSLSDALFRENDIDGLMRQSLVILIEALKSQTAYFAVLNTSGVVYKYVNIGSTKVGSVAPYLLHLNHEKEPLIDVDAQVGSASIRKQMERDDIEILLRLGSKTAPIGVLMLGPKRNGTTYNSQDIALLTISAKNLAIALDNAKKYEQIIHFADTMHKEVTRATSRLRTANEKLKTLDSLKDDFISTASHQLRTPAVSVHDALRMLNMPNMTRQEKDELLVLAEGSSERLVTVVRTMLNMARIQAGHFTIDVSEADMVVLIEKQLDQLTVLAEEKMISIQFNKPKHPVIVQADVAKLNEAVANYIENAIKYSPKKSTIDLNLTEEDGAVRFEVTDHGMGVPESERNSLFDRFYRASNARREQPDGNGIGLYVVKMIAEGHGGQAYFRPGAEEGSVFGFWIQSTTKGTKAPSHSYKIHQPTTHS